MNIGYICIIVLSYRLGINISTEVKHFFLLKKINFSCVLILNIFYKTSCKSWSPVSMNVKVSTLLHDIITS